MSLGSDVDALRTLEADPRFGELNDYVPPLSLVRAFGVSRDEVAHSRMLARLLAPRRHRGAGFVLAALLREMATRPGIDEPLAEKLRTAADESFERVAVHRERLLIDVVVEVDSPVVNLVVGIENKIDAGEQPEQIARYQAALSRAYPGRAAIVAFLTPTGRRPTTARADGPVPGCFRLLAGGGPGCARWWGDTLQRLPSRGRRRSVQRFPGRGRRRPLQRVACPRTGAGPGRSTVQRLARGRETGRSGGRPGRQRLPGSPVKPPYLSRASSRVWAGA